MWPHLPRLHSCSAARTTSTWQLVTPTHYLLACTCVRSCPGPPHLSRMIDSSCGITLSTTVGPVLRSSRQRRAVSCSACCFASFRRSTRCHRCSWLLVTRMKAQGCLIRSRLVAAGCTTRPSSQTCQSCSHPPGPLAQCTSLGLRAPWSITGRRLRIPRILSGMSASKGGSV